VARRSSRGAREGRRSQGMMMPGRPEEVLSRGSDGQEEPQRLLSSSSSGFHDGDILLPAGRIRIRRSSVALYGTILIVFVVATVDTMRTLVIDEKALLTKRGRERHRMRRRRDAKSRYCTELDEPRIWQLFTGWRKLSTCEELDLSLVGGSR